MLVVLVVMLVVLDRLHIACAFVHVLSDVRVLRVFELGAIFLEFRVFQQGIQEIATYGQGRAASLAQRTGSEMDAAIFATDPCSNHKIGADAHKPGIGVVVAGSRLATKLSVLQHGMEQSGSSSGS